MNRQSAKAIMAAEIEQARNALNAKVVPLDVYNSLMKLLDAMEEVFESLYFRTSAIELLNEVDIKGIIERCSHLYIRD